MECDRRRFLNHTGAPVPRNPGQEPSTRDCKPAQVAIPRQYSYEMRTRLNAILGYTELILDNICGGGFIVGRHQRRGVRRVYGARGGIRDRRAQ